MLVSSKYLKQALALPIFRSLPQKFTGRASVIMYHSLTAERLPNDQNERFAPNKTIYIDQETFEDQIKFISKKFRCLDLKEALFELEQGSLPRSSAVITFDDGYLDNLTLALPILEKYKVPAALFVATGLADGSAGLWWQELESAIDKAKVIDIRFNDKRFTFETQTFSGKFRAYNRLAQYLKTLASPEAASFMSLIWEQVGDKSDTTSKILSWDDIRLMDENPLITIGSHSVSHRSLSSLSAEELRSELVHSKVRLEKELGHPVYYFCYPYGTASEVGPREFEAVKQAGYRAAFTTRFGHLQPEHRGHLFSLPRIDLSSQDEGVALDYKLFGVEAIVRSRFRRVVTV